MTVAVDAPPPPTPPLLLYESFSFIVDTLELSLDRGMADDDVLWLYLSGCELLVDLILARGERGVTGETFPPPFITFVCQLVLLCAMLDDVLSMNLELLMWVADDGTGVDDEEFLSFVSDNASNFSDGIGRMSAK